MLGQLPLLLRLNALSSGLLVEAPVGVAVVMVRVIGGGPAVVENGPNRISSCLNVWHVLHNRVTVVL